MRKRWLVNHLFLVFINNKKNQYQIDTGKINYFLVLRFSFQS